MQFLASATWDTVIMQYTMPTFSFHQENTCYPQCSSSLIKATIILISYSYNSYHCLIVLEFYTMPGSKCKGLCGTVEPGYNGHPWDSTSWRSYRGDLLMQ